jgi:S-DNA-T family DNA segregation ATPase FtsK/SpoIIIE
MLPLEELRRCHAGDAGPLGAVLLGLADEPERQRQPPAVLLPGDRALLVLGGPGSGVTNVLDLVQAQHADAAVRVPEDAEDMWDVVSALHAAAPPPGTVVLIDDVDALAQRLPAEYAQVLLERLEEIVRRAGNGGLLVVAGAHRATGAVSRLADLFPRRLMLPYTTRLEHAAAGGDASWFDPSAPAGRGRLDGCPVQIALAPPPVVPSRVLPAPWAPAAAVTGVVARRSPAGRRALAAWAAGGVRVVGPDEYVADPTPVGDGRVVVVGEPDDWQRHWRLLADLRGDHDLVIDTSCAAELRVLAGFRGIPPYCEPGRARAWLIAAGAEPVRIVLPDDDVPPHRQRDALTWPHPSP